MKKEFSYYITEINKVSISELSSICKVTKDQARKYKAGKSLPSLKRAVLIEDTLNIPARSWVDLQRSKEVS